MITCKVLGKGISRALVLVLASLGNANAAMVDFTLTGTVDYGDESAPNAFGLTAGDTITAVGSFDDSVLSGGSGTIDFSSSSTNSLTIYVGTETFTASNDVGFGSGNGPSMTLSSNLLTDFNFYALAGNSGAPADFSSFFDTFDDLDAMSGTWAGTLTVVPVPAAVWLFGSGLLGLAGVARRRKSA